MVNDIKNEWALDDENEEWKHKKKVKYNSSENNCNIIKKSFCDKSVKVLDLSCNLVTGEYAYSKIGSLKKSHVKSERVWLYVFQNYILEDKDDLKKKGMLPMGWMLFSSGFVIGPRIE